jgi:trimeric autotransporter adhesin
VTVTESGVSHTVEAAVGSGRVGKLGRVAALAALVVSLVAAGQAAALAQAGYTAAAGTISTSAGGVGGPARATRVALAYPGQSGQSPPCGVSYAAGTVYVGDTLSVRSVNTSTDLLTTPAGTGVGGTITNGAPSAGSSVGAVCGVTRDHAGNLVLADAGNNMILVAAGTTGTFYGRAMTAGDVYDVAGTGFPAFSGEGGPAVSADLDAPNAAAVDSAGNLVVADSGNLRIRVVAASTGTFYGRAMTAGDIYTVAGDGHQGSSGDGGPATAAELGGPSDVVVDGSGNLVIADNYNGKIRVVAEANGTFYGKPMTAGNIYAVAGDGTQGFSGDGHAATAAELNLPLGAVVDGAGNLAIADTGNNRVRVVAASTGTFYGQPMTSGDIYTVAGNGSAGFGGDGGLAGAAELSGPAGVAVDGTGGLVIADTGNNRIRLVAVTTGTAYRRAMTAGHIYTVAGDGTPGFSGEGGPATHAELDTPYGIAVDRAGNTLVADTRNNRVRVAAATTGTFYGRAMTAGHIYTVAGDGTSGFSGDGGPGTRAELDFPEAVVSDGAGNLVIADAANERIRVVAGSTGTFYGQAMTAGNIYTVAGVSSLGGFGGDGGPATQASLYYPRALAMDLAGNMLIADSFNMRIRVVAAASGTFYGQAMTAGDIYTVAGGGAGLGDGGPATSAGLQEPGGVAVDHHGNLVIGDTFNNRVRVVAVTTGTFYGQAMTAGDIYTVAGGGPYLFQNGIKATTAALQNPAGVAVDGAGDILIADTMCNSVQVVAHKTATIYGQAMKAGYIYSIAGNFQAGFSGDGGPGGQATLDEPQSVSVDGSGSVLVADTNNNRIRMIAG